MGRSFANMNSFKSFNLLIREMLIRLIKVQSDLQYLFNVSI